MSPDLAMSLFGILATLGGLLWRLSSRLTRMDAKLDRLETENRQLRSDVLALQTLLSMLVDKRTRTP